LIGLHGSCRLSGEDAKAGYHWAKESNAGRPGKQTPAKSSNKKKIQRGLTAQSRKRTNELVDFDSRIPLRTVLCLEANAQQPQPVNPTPFPMAGHYEATPESFHNHFCLLSPSIRETLRFQRYCFFAQQSALKNDPFFLSARKLAVRSRLGNGNRQKNEPVFQTKEGNPTLASPAAK